MGSLTNQQIDLTYSGLLKTNDEGPFNNTLKSIQDGLGNNSGIQILNNGLGYQTLLTSDDSFTHGLSVDSTGISFGGTIDFQTSSVDFTNATVIGLPTQDTTYDYGAVGAAGNINMALSGSDGSNDVVVIQAGTNITLTDNGSSTFTIDAAGGDAGLIDNGTTTIYSTVGSTPVSLTNNPLDAVVIGNNTSVDGGNAATVIGNNITTAGEGVTLVGNGAAPGDIYGTAIGGNARGGYFGVGVGSGASSSNWSVALGGDARTETDYGIAIGYGTQSRAQNNICIGFNALVDDGIRVNSVAIGSGAGQTKVAQYSTAVGSQAIAVGAEALALGYNSIANNDGSVALGANVTAVANNTVSMKRLHFTDTIPLNYPDDGTAGANGIPVGGVYHSDGILKIRLA